MRARPVAARARRRADITASVPEFTKRICSTQGMRRQIHSASSSEPASAAPYDQPRLNARFDCGAHVRILVPEDQRTPGHAEVDIAVAVDVDEPAAARFANEARHATHAAKGTHGRVHAAGRDAPRALEEGGGALGLHAPASQRRA